MDHDCLVDTGLAVRFRLLAPLHTDTRFMTLPRTVRRFLPFIMISSVAGACAGAAKTPGDSASLAAAAPANTAAAGDASLPLALDTLQPAIVTDTVPVDSDDPAIWINRANPAQSFVLGTDKGDTNG